MQFGEKFVVPLTPESPCERAADAHRARFLRRELVLGHEWPPTHVEAAVERAMPDQERKVDRGEAFLNSVIRAVRDEFDRKGREHAVEVLVLALPGQLRVFRIVPHDRELVPEGGDRTTLQQVKLVAAQRALDVDRPTHHRFKLDRQARDRRDVAVGDPAGVCAVRP